MVRREEKQRIANTYGYDNFEEYLAGEYKLKKVAEIAVTCGVSENTITRWMKERGLKMKPRGGARLKPIAVNVCDRCGRDRGVNIKLCNRCVKYISRNVESADGFDNVI